MKPKVGGVLETALYVEDVARAKQFYQTLSACHPECAPRGAGRSARDLLLMANNSYFVYLLASRSRNLYTGITNNLGRRVWEHKQGLVPGFTKKYRVHRLVYFETYPAVKRAIDREKEIKSWRREKKVKLVNAVNPSWYDLAEDWFQPAKEKKQVPRLASHGAGGQARNDRIGMTG